MDVNAITAMVGSLGFPIVCCGFLFKQNMKLTDTIKELNGEQKAMIEASATASTNLVNKLDAFIDYLKEREEQTNA